MRIGIDIDDTICDTWNYSLPLMCKYYKKEYQKDKIKAIGYYKIDDLNLNDYMLFAKKNHKKYIMEVPLIKDAKEIINKLKEEGNEIIFITARSENVYTNTYEITYEYLKQNKIKFDKLYVSAKDKKEICRLEKIDLFIDDNISNCLKVQELGIKVLKFGKDTSYSVKQINSWEEIYKEIERK